MEKIPAELLNEPKPLIFVIGTIENEPDLHEKFLSSLRNAALNEADQKEIPSLDYRYITSGHVILGKKSPKEYPTTDGILRSNWLSKHQKQLPSAIVFLTSFCMDWSAGEWIRRESIAQENITKIREAVIARDVKVMVVAFKTGLGTLDKDVLEERTNSMRRHLQLEGRSLTILSIHDLTIPSLSSSSSSSVRRLIKALKDISVNYYNALGKKLKYLERLTGKISENIIVARYNFKAAYYYEFQTQTNRAIRHYRQCHVAVSELLDSTDSSSSLLPQIKTIAEWSNYKICSILLKMGSLKDAVQQFRLHIITFMKLIKKPHTILEYLWMHHQWISDQYIIFAQLLHQFSINPTLSECDRSFYYHCAAKHTISRKDFFLQFIASNPSILTFSSSLTSSLPLSEQVSTVFPGMTLTTSRYAGGHPIIIDPILDEHLVTPEVKLFILALETEMEYKVSHTSIVIKLLGQCLDNINAKSKRRRAHIRYLLAMQYLQSKLYALSYANTLPAIESLSKERWITALIPALQQKLVCAVKLGRLRDCASTCIWLYACGPNAPSKENPPLKYNINNSPVQTASRTTASPAPRPPCDMTTTFLPVLDRVNLHRNLMLILTCDSMPCYNHSTRSETDKYLDDILPASPAFPPASVLSDQDSGIPSPAQLPSLWEEYGIASTPESPPELFIPNGYTLAFPDIQSLIDVNVTMSRLSAEIGQSVQVTVTLTSLLAEVMDFYRLRIHFTNDVIVKSYYSHTGKTNQILLGNGTDSTTYTDLLFVPNVPKIFLFEIVVPEGALTPPSPSPSSSSPSSSSSLSHTLQVDKITLSLKVSSPTASSSSLPSSTDTSPTSSSFSSSSTSYSEFNKEIEQYDNKNSFPATAIEAPSSYLPESGGGDGDSGGDSLAEALLDSSPTHHELRLQDTIDMSDEAAAAAEGDSANPLLSATSSILLDEEEEESRGGGVAGGDVDLKLSDKIRDDNDDDPQNMYEPRKTEPEGRLEQVKQDVEEEEDYGDFATSHPVVEDRQSGGGNDRQLAPTVPPSDQTNGREILFEIPAFIRNNKQQYQSVSHDFDDKPGLSLPLPRLLVSEPTVLRVHPPSSHLRLLSPSITSHEPILHFLQGVMQRIDLSFHSDIDEIHNGYLYLSVDPPPACVLDGAFFWYPDVRLLNQSLLGDSSEDGNTEMMLSDIDIDKVKFHPMLTDSETKQPMYALKIPYQPAQSLFQTAIFIRSEIASSLSTIKLHMEYITKKTLQRPVSKIFEIPLEIVKPLTANFTLSSTNDYLGGGVVFPSRSGGPGAPSPTTVLRGDTVSVSASVACLSSLGKSIEILALVYKQTEEVVKEAIFECEGTSSSSDSSGVEVDVDILSDLRRRSPRSVTSISGREGEARPPQEQLVVSLKRGELFVGHTAIRCRPSSPPSSASTSLSYAPIPADRARTSEGFETSMGLVEVEWRVSDIHFLSAPPPPTRPPSAIAVDGESEDMVTIVVDGEDLTAIPPLPAPFPLDGCDSAECRSSGRRWDWLWPLSLSLSLSPPLRRAAAAAEGRAGAGTETESAAAAAGKSDEVSAIGVDGTTAATRVCRMSFTIPTVQVYDPPFAAVLTAPSVARLGQLLEVSILLKNKLPSAERLLVTVEFRDHVYAVIGSTSTTVELVPRRTAATSFSLIPLITGQVPLPHIHIIWERKKSTVIEVNGPPSSVGGSTARFLFVLSSPM